MDWRILSRFRVRDYRVYFEWHDLGMLVHRILSHHPLKDFLFRSGLKTGEGTALQKDPKFWELIESANSHTLVHFKKYRSRKWWGRRAAVTADAAAQRPYPRLQFNLKRDKVRAVTASCGAARSRN